MIRPAAGLPPAEVDMPATAEPPAREPHFDPVTLGTALGLLAAVAYTATNLAQRHLARPGNGDWALWVACMKALPAALIAWGIIAWRASRGLPALPPRHLVIPLLLTGLMMQFGGNVCFLWALSTGGLALTVPLTFCTIISGGAILGRIFLAEPISRQTAAAMLVLMVSIAVLSLDAGHSAQAMSPNSNSWQTFLAICSACMSGMAYGASGVMIRRTVKGDITLSASLVLLSTTGVVGLGLTSLFRLGPDGLLATTAEEFATMWMAGIFNAIAFFSIGAALRRITVVRVNLLNASQIAMASIVAVMVFDEPLTTWLICGIALTVAGLLLIDKPQASE